MITPAAGFQVDPNNPNGVIPINSTPQNSIIPTTPTPPVTPAKVTSSVTPNTPIVPSTPTPQGTGTQTAENAASVAKAANAGKPGYDVFGNAVAGGSSNQDTLRTNGGTHTGLDGVTQYYNYDNTPVGTTPTNTSGTSNGTNNTDPNSPTLSDQADRQALAQAQADYQKTANSVQTTIANIQNGVTPLNAGENAQISGLQQQFQALIDAQNLANKGAVGGATVNSFATGAYSPLFQVNTINQIASAGAAKVSDLQIKEAQAVAQLTQSFKDNDIKAVQNAWAIYQDASKERTDALQKTITDTQAAIKDAQDAKIAADKVQYDEVTKPIQDAAAAATKNGAPADVVAKINACTDVACAVAASAGYANDPTTPAGQYASYVKSATAAGQTPISAGAFLAKQKYNDAYAAAAGTEAGKNSVSGTGGTSDNGISALTPAAQATLKSNGFTAFNSGTQNLAIQLVGGQIAPSELSKRTTGTSSYNDVLTAADKYAMATTGKHFNIAQADRDYKFATNTTTQNTLNYLGSLVGSDNGSGTISGGNLDQLINLSNARSSEQTSGNPDYAYHPSQGLPPLNDIAQWAKIQTGDPQMAAYYATLLEVSDQVAKVLQGGGGGTSDAKLAQAQALFQKGFTPDQVSAVATQLKELLASRAASMVKDNPYLSDYATQFGVQTNNGVTTTNQKIMQDETVAEGKLSTFYKANPQNQQLVDAIHKQFPDMSAQEVAQKLGI